MFDLVTNASKDIRLQSDALDKKYFAFDTADEGTIHGWNDYNRYAFTAAMLNDQLYGFFTVLPVTNECAELFEQHRLQEEDLTLNYILPHESLRNAEYAYVPAIAIRDLNNFTSRVCVAALMAGMCDLLLNGYDTAKLKKIYANPTTFHGNRLVRRIGFKPLNSFKKPLTGNDMYAVEFNGETEKALRSISRHYSRFVGANPWSPSGAG